MSRFEELRDEWIRVHGATALTQNLHFVFEAAENRIAELEVENGRLLDRITQLRQYRDQMLDLTHRAEHAEAERDTLREQATDLLAAVAELEAELAALRDRRCDGCANWDPDEHTYGWCETVLDEDNPIATRPDFACNRFLPR